MGLDMYLYARVYVGRYENEKNVNLITKIADMEDLACNDYGVYVQIPVMYWRKANAIHSWFVENVQNGEDECRAHEFYRDKLEALLEACKLALAAYESEDYKTAEEILTPKEGFFFGSYEIDDYYADNLRETIEQFEKLLEVADAKFESFIYQSSW